MPAYNAARTLERTYADIPHELVDRIILVDDVSRDETVDIARQLGLDVIIHSQNRGYGGNQKTCYDAALAAGADIVVMLHPDYQYDATRIPALIAPIAAGERDLMLGSRFLGDPLAGGMPRWKYVSNRFLTGVENLAFGLHLSEYHTGLRAYSRQPARDDPVPAEQRRLRVRPGAHRPGRGGRASGRASARSPSRPATSRRPARSASSAASCTACRPCGWSLATSSIASGSGARPSWPPAAAPTDRGDADQPKRPPAWHARDRDQRRRALDPRRLGRHPVGARGPGAPRRRPGSP